MSDPTVVAAELARRRAQLEEQLAELVRPTEDPGNISFGKRVGDGTTQAVDRLAAVPAHDALTALLGEVTRAEQKVADGSYGSCDVCGEPIATGRLEAKPWAVRCLRHAGIA